MGVPTVGIPSELTKNLLHHKSKWKSYNLIIYEPLSPIMIGSFVLIWTERREWLTAAIIDPMKQETKGRMYNHVFNVPNCFLFEKFQIFFDWSSKNISDIKIHEESANWKRSLCVKLCKQVVMCILKMSITCFALYTGTLHPTINLKAA